MLLFGPGDLDPRVRAGNTMARWELQPYISGFGGSIAKDKKES